MLALVRTWFEDQDRAGQAEIEAALDRTRAYLRKHATANLNDLTTATRSAEDGWRDGSFFYLLPMFGGAYMAVIRKP